MCSVRHSSRRALGVGILVLALAVLVCGPVFAAWTNTAATGSWNESPPSRTAFSAEDGENDGFQKWTDDLGDCSTWTGLTFNVNTTRFHCTGFDWWGYGEKRLLIAYVIQGADWRNITIMYEQNDVTNTWGILWDRKAGVSAAENPEFEDDGSDMWVLTERGYAGIGDYVLLTGHDSVEIRVVRSGNALIVEGLLYTSAADPQVLLNWTTDDCGAAWFADIHLYQYIRHSGYGEFTGELYDDVTGATHYSGPVNTDLTRGFWDQLGMDIRSLAESVLPTWANEYLDAISGIGTWVWSLLVVFAQAVVAILPFLPVIVILYFCDVGFTAITTGEIAPVGAMFQSMYDTLTGVGSLVVGIGSAVVDFIHFW